MCFSKKNKKTDVDERKREEIRKGNKAFDFGLSGKSNDDPNKWIDELNLMDEITLLDEMMDK